MTRTKTELLNTFSNAMQSKYNTDLNSMARRFINEPEFGQAIIEEILGILNDENQINNLGLGDFSKEDLDLIECSYSGMYQDLYGDIVNSA